MNPAPASTYEKGNLVPIDGQRSEKADPADWSEDDRQNACASVAAFRDAADAFISAFGEGGSEAGGTSLSPETT
jgi:hypothetical protein